MNLPRFQTVFCIEPGVCPACDHLVRAADKTTGLCVDCWRVVVLARAAGREQVTGPDKPFDIQVVLPRAAETREPLPPGDAARDGAKGNPDAARVLG